MTFSVQWHQNNDLYTASFPPQKEASSSYSGCLLITTILTFHRTGKNWKVYLSPFRGVGERLRK